MHKFNSLTKINFDARMVEDIIRKKQKTLNI